MSEQLYKYPRLYLNAAFEENAEIPLEEGQAHYLKNVLRKTIGDKVRVFNGRDGEWLAEIGALGKKKGALILQRSVREQPAAQPEFHLIFAPIKKHRMDMQIEKAVELGASGFFPVLTNHTENRKFNDARVRAQIIEAAEQCERLTMPSLAPLQKLENLVRGWDKTPLYACLERHEGTRPIAAYDFRDGASFIIGPEGGFDLNETAFLRDHKDSKAISLGETILRAETATQACLSYARLSLGCA